MNRLLVLLAVVVSIQSLGAAPRNLKLNLNKLPRYPGHEAYLNLEKYLLEQVETDSLDENIKQLGIFIEELESEPYVPPNANNAARLLLAMDDLLVKNRCDAATVGVFDLNLKAVAQPESTDGSQQADAKPRSRMSTLILGYLQKIAENCEKYLASRLQKAIESITEDGYKNLTSLLSKQFLMDWQESDNPERGLKLNMMNLKPDLTHEDDLGHGMILGKLMGLSDGDELVGTRLSDYQHYSAKCWPKMAPDQLTQVVRKFLMRPCTSYLRKVEKNVLRLFYQAAEHLGDQWAAYFVRRQPEEVKLELFRFEFCNINPQMLTKQLWLRYRKCVYPNWNFDERDKKGI